MRAVFVNECARLGGVNAVEPGRGDVEVVPYPARPFRQRAGEHVDPPPSADHPPENVLGVFPYPLAVVLEFGEVHDEPSFTTAQSASSKLGPDVVLRMRCPWCGP